LLCNQVLSADFSVRVRIRIRFDFGIQKVVVAGGSPLIVLKKLDRRAAKGLTPTQHASNYRRLSHPLIFKVCGVPIRSLSFSTVVIIYLNSILKQ
jgi:hypothetical protein